MNRILIHHEAPPPGGKWTGVLVTHKQPLVRDLQDQNIPEVWMWHDDKGKLYAAWRMR